VSDDRINEEMVSALMHGTRETLDTIRSDRVAVLGEALSGVLDTYRRWLHFPDAQLLYLCIAAVLANRMEEGDPVWLIVVGGSSRGKTETLSGFDGLPDVRVVGSLTEAALLSGTPKKEQAKNASGGLLRELPAFGATLVIKDFGAILTLPRDRRAIVVQALRDVYDGRYVRDVGTGGGLRLQWTGRLGLLAGATGALDAHHAVVGALGERWLTLRLALDRHDDDGVDDEDEMARRALAGGQTRTMRTDLTEALCGYVESLTPPPMVNLDAADTELVIALSVLVTNARSPVERDARDRTIEQVPQGEGPSRFARQLHKLALCLYALGLDQEHVQAAIRRLAFDSIPPTRRQALDHLLARAEPCKTGAVATTFGLPTVTVTRVLEDLAAHGLLRRRKTGEAHNAPYEWWPSRRAVSLYERINKPLEQAEKRSSEMSQSPSLRERHSVERDISEELRSEPLPVDDDELERLAELGRQLGLTEESPDA
jgi:hypothetical protein